MTVAEVMDLAPARARGDVATELRLVNAKLDRLVEVLDGIDRRVEAVEELREDLWPMVQGVA